ncbi:hypothetical protein DSO57_1033630 [Entomophthora muscae]|uniref:Uncharacterized protein n=1 Tax=Entomophthora muscae TaxID=34485 RepID=A0ACC2SPN3_9FUNG|nr:hypothetical protein DSO57_1033630 [Entomophthora muscae]
MRSWAMERVFVSKFEKTFEWTADHIQPEALEKLRLVGDPLADEALQHLGAGDVIRNMAPLAPVFPAVQALRDQLTNVPSWVDFDQIQRGQRLFWSYQPLCASILLSASLVGGFGARRITSTLQCTSYLTCKDTAWKRMVETALMIQDVMSFGALRVGGAGWCAAVKVRMLHAQVRRHVLRQSKYDREANGIPVNQEDLLSTLISFSTTVVYGLRLIGVPVTEEEADDYIAAWRYVGYLLGIQHLHHFKSFDATMILGESVVMHLVDPDASCARLANNIIEACENRPPLFLSKRASAALSRLLLGNEWADRLGLPHSRVQTFLVQVWIAIIRVLLQVANSVNRNWVNHYIRSISYSALHSQLENKIPTYKFIPSPKPVWPSIILVACLFYLLNSAI